jgi:uncharacterized membrane protein YfcA
MHMAAGTSLASMIFTMLAALYSNQQRGLVLWKVAAKLTPGIMLGSILGAFLAGLLSSRALEVCFGIFLLIVVARMLFFSSQPSQHGLPGPLGFGIASVIIGIQSGLLGVGGAFITIPFLTYCNVSIRQAAGTSVALALPITLIGTLIYSVMGSHTMGLPAWTTGYVYWPAAIVVACFGMLFVKLGSFLSGRLPTHIIEKIFALLLLVMAVRLLLSAY